MQAGHKSNERLANKRSTQNLNLLFWGLPGTGKTEFAKHLAKEFKKELIVKRASDLFGMYVGETEKLIRSAFRKTERNEGILLIDEADSFLQNREDAGKRWEISQVNEFLTCMESFSGILICTTNFLDNLDIASLRRFSWKVEFKPLRNSDKVSLFETYFHALCDPHLDKISSKNEIFLGNNQKNRIEAIQNLTPGDFQAVWSRVQFMDKPIEIEILIAELESEVSYKKSNKKSLGFCA